MSGYRYRGAVGAALLAALVSTPAAADAVADFYKGKTVNLMIGFGAGGGNDSWARTVARHIGRHIPGNPTVVPQNMPGAGGLKLTNFLYNAAPKSGAVFGLVNRGIPLEPLLGGKGISFDVMKMNWIGSPDRDITVCMARKDGPVQHIRDIFKKELVVGATGSGADTNIYPTFLANLLDMKFKVIRGYKGTQEIRLALERGEVQGVCSNFDSLARASQYKEGKLRILLQVALQKDKDVPDSPLVTEFVKSESDRQALEAFLARIEIGRPFVAPPGVPKERVAALRRAFDATMKDPAFLADTKKQRLNVFATTGEQLTAIIQRIYATPKPAIARIARALGRDKEKKKKK
jgi:tripartite-type tricarboxylate transporter receptor subunit TctC